MFVSIAVCALLIFILISSPPVPDKTIQEMCPVVDFGGGILCTFVESLQRQYKDRSSNGTCVFRMVSASFFILRM